MKFIDTFMNQTFKLLSGKKIAVLKTDNNNTKCAFQKITVYAA